MAVLLTLLLGVAACSGDSSPGALDFEGLTEGQRVYDQTGDSLTGAETDELQQRLETLEAETGADVIAYVRELDADSEATFDQVEALQQAWVAPAQRRPRGGPRPRCPRCARHRAGQGAGDHEQGHRAGPSARPWPGPG